MNSALTEQQLEAALAALRPSVSYPPTPPLAASVHHSLVAAPGRRRWASIGPAVTWYAVAAGLAVILSIALLWPPAREAVATRLGLRTVSIEYVPAVPAEPRTDPRPQLGTAVDFDNARSRAPFVILMPPIESLGSPDEVFINPAVPGTEVSLGYRPRPGLAEVPGTGLGLLLSQSPGRGISPYIEKGAGPGTSIQAVRVGDRSGLWIDGARHSITYIGPSGGTQAPAPRLAANVLLWEQDGLVLRMESALSLDAAIRIATSVR